MLFCLVNDKLNRLLGRPGNLVSKTGGRKSQGHHLVATGSEGYADHYLLDCWC